MGDFTVAAPMETNLVSDAVVDTSGKDISGLNWLRSNR